MKKFKKEFLSEVLGFTSEEIKLVMACQKLFPELLENEAEGFCVDGRTLWNQLSVEKAFSTWIKSMLEKVEGKENQDYNEKWVDDKGASFKGNLENTKVTELTGQGYKIEYVLTLEIAMFAGVTNRANDKLKANSKLVRKYFLLMEKAVKGMQEHISVREPEKENYNKMKEVIINDYCSKHDDVTEMDKKYLMIRESNMINVNLTGYKANEIKSKLGYQDVQTREHLEVEINKIINELELMIIGLVYAGVEFNERSKIIKNICDNKYSHLIMNSLS